MKMKKSTKRVFLALCATAAVAGVAWALPATPSGTLVNFDYSEAYTAGAVGTPGWTIAHTADTALPATDMTLSVALGNWQFVNTVASSEIDGFEPNYLAVGNAVVTIDQTGGALTFADAPLVKSGPGRLDLGANVLTNVTAANKSTTVTGGTLVLKNQDSIVTGGGARLINGANVSVDVSGAYTAPETITNAGTMEIVVGSAFDGANTLTNNGTLIVNGRLAAPFSVTGTGQVIVNSEALINPGSDFFANQLVLGANADLFIGFSSYSATNVEIVSLNNTAPGSTIYVWADTPGVYKIKIGTATSRIVVRDANTGEVLKTDLSSGVLSVTIADQSSEPSITVPVSPTSALFDGATPSDHSFRLNGAALTAATAKNLILVINDKTVGSDSYTFDGRNLVLKQSFLKTFSDGRHFIDFKNSANNTKVGRVTLDVVNNGSGTTPASGSSSSGCNALAGSAALLLLGALPLLRKKG